VSNSSTSVNFYQTLQRHIAEDGQPVNNLCIPSTQVETLKEIDNSNTCCNILFSVDFISCTELCSRKVCACLLLILQSPDLSQCIKTCQRLETSFSAEEKIETVNEICLWNSLEL
jgi:hypothetical protein